MRSHVETTTITTITCQIVLYIYIFLNLRNIIGEVQKNSHSDLLIVKLEIVHGKQFANIKSLKIYVP